MNLNCGALSEPCSAVLAHKVQGWVVSRFYLAPSDSKYCRCRNIKCHLNLFLYILLGICWSDTLALNSLRVIKESPLAFSNTYLTMPLENPQLPSSTQQWVLKSKINTPQSQYYQLLIGKASLFLTVPRQKPRVTLVWNQKMCLKRAAEVAHVFWEHILTKSKC